jgi:hypothetical protein
LKVGPISKLPTPASTTAVVGVGAAAASLNALKLSQWMPWSEILKRLDRHNPYQWHVERPAQHIMVPPTKQAWLIFV